MWIKKVSTRDRNLVFRAVVQLASSGSYMTVQDKHGAILGSAKFQGKLAFDQAERFLINDNLYPQGDWIRPRIGVFLLYVTDIKG